MSFQDRHAGDLPLAATELLESLQDPILLADGQLVIRWFNGAFGQLLGWSIADVAGRSLNEMARENGFFSLLLPLVSQVRDHHQPVRGYELTGDISQDDRRSLLVNISVLPASASWLEPMISLMLKDITPLRTAIEALEHKEQELRVIFENAREFAIFSMDQQGRVTAWNPGAERLLGYTESEILGQNARIIFTPEDQAKGEAERELQTALREGRAENERWHIRKDGSRFWGSGFVMVLRQNDHPLALLKIMRDMTAAHRLQEQRRTRAEVLEQRVAHAVTEAAERARQLETVTRHLHQVEQHERRRLAEVLHGDLQQILVAISMRLEVVDSQTDPRRFLQETRQLVEQAIETARSLSHELSPAMLRSRGFVAALEWLANIFQRRHRLAVTIQATPGIGDDVPVDIAETLLQMVRELLFNVVKHAEATQATVAVDLNQRGGLRVVVADNGAGCAPERMADDPGGHGLRSVRERLLIWQGELRIENAAAGCRITMDLPPHNDPGSGFPPAV